ncbi:prepilin peptidase [Streptococcus sp. 121]|uniref:prepilin peptidase n=1 Tax=Streptococcus sp. 121 TaxID=2797637 RepID=UPI0018F0E5F8|nr:A24 family peptidase [Streptococcus sp. 121]MBJ6745000.1 prepilin peptidase [Streptococcus sp. 121]
MTDLLIFFLGASLASFLTAWADRYPQSILYPPSHCMTCRIPLKWWELIPILSFVCLFGKCRYCLASIPLASLANEIQGGLIAYAYNQGWLTPSWTLFLFMSLMLSHFDRKSTSFPLCFWLIPHCILTLLQGLQISPYFLVIMLVFAIFPLGMGAGDWAYLASLSLFLPLTDLLLILQLATCLAIIDFLGKKGKGVLPFLPILHTALLLGWGWQHLPFF